MLMIAVRSCESHEMEVVLYPKTFSMVRSTGLRSDRMKENSCNLTYDPATNVRNALDMVGKKSVSSDHVFKWWICFRFHLSTHCAIACRSEYCGYNLKRQ